MDQQPDEIILQIFGYIKEYYPVLHLVCRRFHQLVKSDLRDMLANGIIHEIQYKIMNHILHYRRINLIRLMSKLSKPSVWFEKNYDSVTFWLDRSSAVRDACAFGCENVFMLLVNEHGLRVEPDFLRIAVKGGCLNIVKIIHKRYRYNFSSWEFTHALYNNDLETIKYIHECGNDFPRDFADFVVMSGNLEILKYGWDNDIKTLKSVCETAISSNKLRIVEYIVGKCDGQVSNIWMELAVANNRLDLIKYFRRLGASYYEKLCEVAVSKRNLNMLMFLHEDGCGWGSGVYQAAVDVDMPDVLEYAFKGNCPEYKNLYEYAVKQHSPRCVEYLKLRK